MRPTFPLTPLDGSPLVALTWVRGQCDREGRLDALGSETLAWLGWLVALPSSIATKAAGMNASEWAAWVQAVGSILAIVAGFLTMFLQNRHADKIREAKRARAEEVVVFRVSGFLADLGHRIKPALKECEVGRANASLGGVLSDVITELRLNMPSRIDGVLADLHYLLAGSGDIAQLDHLVRGYEAWLDGTLTLNTKPGGPSPRIDETSLRDTYARAEGQLNAMNGLLKNAVRYTGPIQDQAAKRDGAVIVPEVKLMAIVGEPHENPR
jgi:hypothetical protein